jgi:hypothetical protein
MIDRSFPRRTVSLAALLLATGAGVFALAAWGPAPDGPEGDRLESTNDALAASRGDAIVTSGDKAFNREFYVLASALESWNKEETVGKTTVYTPGSGSSEILLSDKSGIITTVTVPLDGSLVVSPKCYVVSHEVVELSAPSDGEAK